MTKIVTLYFILLSFCLNAQVNNLDVKALQDEISKYEKSGNINSIDYSNLLNKLAAKYYKQGKYSEAEPLFIKSLDIIKVVLGEKHQQYATILNCLASVYDDEGKYSEAEPLLLKAIEIRKEILGEKDSYYIKSLNDLAALYDSQGVYSKAEQIYIKVLDLTKKTVGVNDPNYATSLNNLGNLYFEQSKYKEAEPLVLKSLEIRKKILGEKDPEYATSLNNLAALYSVQGKYSEAEPLFLNSLKIIKEVLGEKHPDYSTSLYTLAQLYELQGKYSEAETLFLEAIDIQKLTLGENNPDYANSLHSLGELYIEQGKYKEAEPLLLKSLGIRRVILGEKHLDYVDSINILAMLYQNQGRYFEAEPLFIKSLEIRKEILGNKNIDYATSLINLANLYSDEGKYLKAEPLFLIGTEIIEENLGENHPNYATCLSHLAGLYQDQGKYSEAELLYLKILKIRKKNLGEKHPDYAATLNGLAILYDQQGKYSEAEFLYLKANEIRKEILGEKHPNYSNSLNNLAVLYDHQGKYAEAEILYLKAKEIRREILGEKHPDYAISLNCLASLYEEQERHSEAEPLFLEALDIQKEILGEKHPDYATSMINLASLYENQKKYLKAEPLYLKALEIKKEIFGEIHPNYISLLYDLANYYRVVNLNNKSSFYIENFLEKNKIRILEDLYGFTEKELFNYLKIKNNYFIFPLSFLNDFPNKNSGITNSCYSNELLIKNISIRNQERIKKSIENTDNKSLRNKYQKFISNKKQIAKLHELPLKKQSSDLNLLIIETEQIEKELTLESNTFSDYKKGMSISLNEIKNKLKKNEVSIDIIAYRYWNKKWNDSIVYSAFILKKDYVVPKFISLFEQNQLDFLLSRNKTHQDSIRINQQYLDKAISDLFLNPLKKEIEGVTTIYLSPIGLGHQIDFAALPITVNQTFGEKYKLHILNSPAELVDYKVTTLDKKSNIEFLLYGGIDYNKSTSKVNLDNNKEVVANSDDNLELRAGSGISGFDYIDGTNKEVNQIRLKGNQNGFTTTIFKESEASKESILKLDGRTTPFVLHLATHGFFFADPLQELPNDNKSIEGKSKIYKASDDPMLRSGLVFAGANNYWNKTNDDTTFDNGILTASEISNLDLSACQLVALSACETGLGEVKGSEGVFGLQRAFKMAGVKNIIMSLWKVPDTQTAELFDIFYSECFAGKTIHEAFQSAQTKMKAKYSPYYWAGFVLLE